MNTNKHEYRIAGGEPAVTHAEHRRVVADTQIRAHSRPFVVSQKTRLAILASHPIQYFAPWFRHLATRFDLEVLYAHQQDARGQAEAGFGVQFEWDVPLLDGYRYRWLKNVSHRPGLQTFGGCDTPELFDLVRPERYDALLVLGWNRKSFVQGIRAAWRNGVPVFARGDSHLGTRRSALHTLIKFLPYRWFLPRIDAHLYVGQRNKVYLRHYGVREEQLFFSPHFVDNEFFTARAAVARRDKMDVALRKELGIPRDAFVALFLGKFIPKKRPLDLVKAAQVLVQHGRLPNLHLLFVGSGELGRELRESCHVVFDAEKSVGPGPGVESTPSHLPSAISHLPPASFAGFVNQRNLPAYYSASDVLVLPGCESWGLVVNEAMASGVPAIVSDAAGCAPDVIEEGGTGWVFPARDVPALAQRLIEFRGANADALRRKFADYSMARATEGLERALTAVIHEHSNAR
jgi:glycosyltransferase involved in cell wall biosynthesis